MSERPSLPKQRLCRCTRLRKRHLSSRQRRALRLLPFGLQMPERSILPKQRLRRHQAHAPLPCRRTSRRMRRGRQKLRNGLRQTQNRLRLPIQPPRSLPTPLLSTLCPRFLALPPTTPRLIYRNPRLPNPHALRSPCPPIPDHSSVSARRTRNPLQRTKKAHLRLPWNSQR